MAGGRRSTGSARTPAAPELLICYLLFAKRPTSTEICVFWPHAPDEQPVSPGYRRPSCCTNAAPVRLSDREIKKYRLYPHILSREKNLPSRQDEPALLRLAEVRHSACPTALAVAIRTPTKRADFRDQQILARLTHNFDRARVRDLTVPTGLTLWQSMDAPCGREQIRETIRVGPALGRRLRRVHPEKSSPG